MSFRAAEPFALTGKVIAPMPEICISFPPIAVINISPTLPILGKKYGLMPKAHYAMNFFAYIILKRISFLNIPKATII